MNLVGIKAQEMIKCTIIESDKHEPNGDQTNQETVHKLDKWITLDHVLTFYTIH